jgi:hypothetical protein
MSFDQILQDATLAFEYGAPIAAALGAIGAALNKSSNPTAQKVGHALVSLFVDFGKLAQLFVKKDAK